MRWAQGQTYERGGRRVMDKKQMTVTPQGTCHLLVEEGGFEPPKR